MLAPVSRRISAEVVFTISLRASEVCFDMCFVWSLFKVRVGTTVRSYTRPAAPLSAARSSARAAARAAARPAAHFVHYSANRICLKI